jgi:3-phenylpropionate/trans-cinnamate dioxygenase ferredoxin reductase subunit
MTVTFTDRTTLACDLTVLATGGVPNCEWLESSGLTIENGVRCDARCFAIAGQERIVAAGDVARWDHKDYQEPIRVEHWTNAGEQGAAAATALLDPSSAPPFRPLLSFWTDQYGQRLQSIGAPWLGTAIKFVKGSSHDPKFLALAVRQDQITGAVALNMPAGLIEWRSRIGSRHD